MPEPLLSEQTTLPLCLISYKIWSLTAFRSDCPCEHEGGGGLHRETGGIPVRWVLVISLFPIGSAKLSHLSILCSPGYNENCTRTVCPTFSFFSGGRGEDSSVIITLPECSAFSDIPEEALAKVFTYLTLIPRCALLHLCSLNLCLFLFLSAMQHTRARILHSEHSVHELTMSNVPLIPSLCKWWGSLRLDQLQGLFSLIWDCSNSDMMMLM